MTKTSKGKKQPLLVRHSSGTLQPFLRGMVTHDLVQRGLPFEQAYAIARSVRDRLTDRLEIGTAELRDVIEAEIAETVPDIDPASLALEDTVPSRLTVSYGGEAQPFSRGLLARSLVASGLDLDRAYALVLRFQKQLVEERIARVDARELARRMADLLEQEEDRSVAARYLLIRRIQRLPKPLVLYCGGASGTGKSTLSLELAPLLRIFRINATDTIRQVMRMVFSPAILPSLHRSSFEVREPYETEGDGDETRQSLVRSFEEQAIQVAVGVRAVVDRCLVENLSTIVEGVHLLPGVVPFTDLEGAAYQQMVLLTTLDEEVHRSHFLARATLKARPPEHYLEHFPAIRLQQQYLLDLAEDHEVPLLDSADRESMVPRALRLMTSALERQLPWLGTPAGTPRETRVKGLLLIVDGLPDRPVRGLGGRTPLQAANTPHLDRLAREGRTGLADPVAPGVVPDTASGNLALFGQPPGAMKRGPIEAIGAGLELHDGDIALRGNFATLDDNGWVIDRRAGRLRDDAPALAEALDRLAVPGHPEVEVLVRPGTEHRLAIVLRGRGLSSGIAGSDPGEAAPPGPPLSPRPLDPADAAAARTAEVLAAFEQAARELLAGHPLNRERRERSALPANALLTRGAGRVHALSGLSIAGQPLRLSCIGGDATVLGIAAMLGGERIRLPSMTANLDTDLEAKFEAALRALSQRDLVVLHIKGADIAAHDCRADLKVSFLEHLDRALGSFLDRLGDDVRIAVASDHATLSETGQHAADPVPVLLWGPGIEPDGVESFDESAVALGELERFPLQLLVERLFATPL